MKKSVHKFQVAGCDHDGKKVKSQSQLQAKQINKKKVMKLMFGKDDKLDA
jgi:hypothetical protein